MDENKALEFIRQQEPTFLEKARKRGYICPVCGNGTGADGDGIVPNKASKSPHYICFKCHKSADIFEWYGLANGLTDFFEQKRGAARHYGIAIDGPTSSSATHLRTVTEYNALPDYTSGAKRDTQPEYSQEETPKEEPAGDYSQFFLQAHAFIGQTDYPQTRGLSQATIDRFSLGFLPAWRHPKAPRSPQSPRLIIPTSPNSYIARDTRAELPAGAEKYAKSKVGETHVFNSEALRNAQTPIFVTEGEIDALSIIEAGGEAVALGSTANNKFIEMLRAEKPAQPLILALDNDKAGERGEEELAKTLQELGISFYRLNVYGEHKDANEALTADREDLAAAIERINSSPEEAIKDALRKEYAKNSVAAHLDGFMHGIAASVNTPTIPTGFTLIDTMLDGGLYEGLYTVGAISSLGKTTLIMQIADQIAQAGQDVLIFSLEMSRTELMSKSISRHTLQNVLADLGKYQGINNAKTNRGITDGKRWANYSNIEKELILASVQDYASYADHLFISEGVGDIGVMDIKKTVEEHVYLTGNKPVIIVDYLQILAPYSERSTDKQNTDKAVLELKRISRDYKIPVIAISSFNRANYSNAVTMEAFKESGAVEYSSDVLIGLQLQGAGQKDFDANEAKNRSPREVELVVLKNRNGKAHTKTSFEYYPMFNYFKEV